MRWRTALVLIFCAILGGCSSYSQPPGAFHKILTEPYRLDAGDRLRVTVFGEDTLSNVYLVDQAGYISMPLIGAVPVRGATTEEVEVAVSAQLRNGYMRNPDVSIEVSQYRPFFIMGEVRNAGQYTYVSGMTVQTAVAIAGGFTARGEQRTVDVTRQINGEIVSGQVPITAPIRPGDTIYVRERFL